MNKIDGTKVFVDLIEIKSLLWALAEMEIPKDKWSYFTNLYELRSSEYYLNVLQADPDQLQDKNSIRELQEKIDQLKSLVQTQKA
jgi:hypothetical protein